MAMKSPWADTHDVLSRFSGRPPGMPPSTCQGSLRRLAVFDETETLVSADDAQGGEGDLGERVWFVLFECRTCTTRIPTVVTVDGRQRIRNEYRAS